MQEQEAQGEDMRIQEIKARKAGKTSSLSPRMRSLTLFGVCTKRLVQVPQKEAETLQRVFLRTGPRYSGPSRLDQALFQSKSTKPRN